MDSGAYRSYDNIFRETKLFYAQRVNGIVGLNHSTDSYEYKLGEKYLPNIVDNYSKEYDAHNVFSVCLAKQGGYITIGGYRK